MHSFRITLIVLVFSSLTAAQMLNWEKTFGGSDDDGGQSVVITSKGEIVIAGFKSSNSRMDVLLMKTDASGNEIWSRIFNLGINDWGRDLKQTPDGGFIIAGMTEVNPQTFDPFLIKTDSLGNLQWVRQYDYGLGEDDRGHAVWVTSDGGYVIAGQTWLMHGAFGNYDMYIIKTDMNGNVQWTKVFYRENEGGDVALGIQQLADKGFIIGGFTQSSIWASYIIRTDSLGNAVWSNIYPGAWQSECYDIQSTPDGGFILTGTESSFETDTDLLIIKLNASGGLVWKKIYGTEDAENGEYIRQLQDGGFIIAGMSTHGAGGYDTYVVRTNSTGDSLWSATVGGTGDDRAFSVASAEPGNYLVAGWSWSYGAGLGDVYLLKFSEAAVPVELTDFTARSQGNDVILEWSTATEKNNSGFEIMKSDGISGWKRIGFIPGAGTTQAVSRYSFTDHSAGAGVHHYKLRQFDHNGTYEYSGTVEITIDAPEDFLLEQNYPNPFNPVTRISFALPQPETVTLKVYDILGREMRILINSTLEAGKHTVDFNAGNLPGGTYIYEMKAGNFVQSGKMLLLK